MTSPILLAALTVPLISTPSKAALMLVIMAFYLAILLVTAVSIWIAIITLVIYVGGLIVLFSYFLSISPNFIITHPTIKVLVINTLPLMILQGKKLNYEGWESRKIIRDLMIYTPRLLILAYVLYLTLLLVATTTKSMGRLRPFTRPSLN